MRFEAWREETLARLSAGSRLTDTARGPVEWAERGEGPTLLVLHGRPGGYDQGLLIARGLGDDLGRWVSVSRPGYLRTPLDTGRTPDEQADAYAALLDTLKVDAAAVVALSGGGPSALAFATRHPGRCRALALVSALAVRRAPGARAPGQKLFDAWVVPSDRLAWRLRRLLPSHPRDPGLGVLRQMLELPGTLRLAGSRNDVAQFGTLADPPGWRYGGPVLAVHGTADRVVPLAHAEAVKARLPQAELRAVPGAGHGALWSHAGAVVPAVRAFLEQAGGGGPG